MERYLIELLVLAPVVLGALAWIAKPKGLRTAAVAFGAVAVMALGLWFAATYAWAAAPSSAFPRTWGLLPRFVEPGVALAVLAIGCRIRCWPVVAMSAIQLALAFAGPMQAAPPGAEAATPFRVDALSVTMVLIVTLIGAPTAIYAIGYMAKHEEHGHLPGSASTGRFFLVMIAFLGLMNGLVLTDDLRWLCIFWEGTTLCSYFLIGHDGTPEAKASARRALLINTFGGVAMALAAHLAERATGSESLSGMLAVATTLPMMLLVLGAMTKSAQLPFQSWLLGAMVAPTPVSALLHSSTMVKAGSYLILRLSPAMAGTRLAMVVAIAGGFTFAVCGALGVGQSNGKKVLAYSTIGNLGLIAACAGIGTPLAYAAALMLLMFHALSKALLFLCMGTIEQHIGSRHIEDMGGILFKLPLTTVIAICGMISMMAPPFGMLMGKWMAIESAAHTPVPLFLFVIGSALTIFFWSKWIGRITTTSHHPTYPLEPVSRWMLGVLATMTAAMVAFSSAAMPVYHAFIKPLSQRTFAKHVIGADVTAVMNAIDGFMTWPLFAALALVLVAGAIPAALVRRQRVVLPYLGGENVVDGDLSFQFRSLMDRRETAMLNSYYFPRLFGEDAIMRWATPVAVLIVLTLLRIGFL